MENEPKKLIIGKLFQTTCCGCCELAVGLRIFWVFQVISGIIGLVMAILQVANADKASIAAIACVFMISIVIGITAGIYGFSSVTERNSRKAKISFFLYALETSIGVIFDFILGNWIQSVIRIAVSTYLLYEINNFYKILKWGQGEDEPWPRSVLSM